MNSIKPDPVSVELYSAHRACLIGEAFTTTAGVSITYRGTRNAPHKQSLVLSQGDRTEEFQAIWGAEAIASALRKFKSHPLTDQ